MNHPNEQWIVTADGRGASLYSCQKTPGGELHITPVKSLVNSHFHDHERGRPNQMGGAERAGGNRSGASAAPHSVAVNHEPEEELRRFARDMRAWLGAAAAQAGSEKINVFAAAGLLGVLRKEMARDHQGPERVELREAGLADLRPAELSVHPAVLSAVGAELGLKK